MIKISQDSQRLTSEALKSGLMQHRGGTEQWHRHALNPNLLYTDGIEYFAEQGGQQGAYWFVDKVAIEICPFVRKRKNWFSTITIRVQTDQTAQIEVGDGNHSILKTLIIRYTDLQVGEWLFYLVDDASHLTLLLPCEY